MPVSAVSIGTQPPGGRMHRPPQSMWSMFRQRTRGGGLRAGTPRAAQDVREVRGREPVPASTAHGKLLWI